MTDNVTANAGSGGATFATDDDGTAHHPYVKLEFGADNTQTKVSTTDPLPVTLANTGANATAVKVDGSAATQPVSAASLPLPTGAATAAKQPALGTAGAASSDVLTVQGIASMTALKVDGSAVTQPVSVASLPLPTGASTAAKQPALGTAGTASSDVLTVQGIASMTALKVDGSAVTQPVSGTVTVNALPAGTNNIGDVDVLTQPARAATTDTITAKLATDAIQNGTTALTPKFAVIDAATSGDNTLVAAVTSKKIRVLSVWLVASAAVTVRFESGASGTALTGQMQLAANGGFVLPFSPVGHFETASGVLLNLELSGATSVDGSLCYVEV